MIGVFVITIVRHCSVSHACAFAMVRLSVKECRGKAERVLSLEDLTSCRRIGHRSGCGQGGLPPWLDPGWEGCGI
jgi:hypothetical protein